MKAFAKLVHLFCLNSLLFFSTFSAFHSPLFSKFYLSLRVSSYFSRRLSQLILQPGPTFISVFLKNLLCVPLFVTSIVCVCVCVSVCVCVCDLCKCSCVLAHIHAHFVIISRLMEDPLRTETMFWIYYSI